MHKSAIKTKFNSLSKFKKIVAIFLLFIFLLSLVPIGINIYVIAYSSRYILSTEEYKKADVDCVMVLGAGVNGDKPSDMLEERLNVGIKVYNSGCTDRLLMTGDHGRTEYDEVNIMKGYAINTGIPAQNIFMDHAGFSTYESMYRARDVFDVKSLIIVTQKYHLYRAVYNARQLGLEAYGVAADGQYYYGLINNTFNSARESLARCKDFVYCIIKPPPTYLGEVIPISASGDLTDDKV